MYEKESACAGDLASVDKRAAILDNQPAGQPAPDSVRARLLHAGTTARHNLNANKILVELKD